MVYDGCIFFLEISQQNKQNTSIMNHPLLTLSPPKLVMQDPYADGMVKFDVLSYRITLKVLYMSDRR